VVEDINKLARMLVCTGQPAPVQKAPPVRKSSSLGRFVRAIFGRS
jgi:hypothetical protein